MKDRIVVDDDLLGEFKKQEIAVHLVNLIHHSEVSRAELARRLGWAPSRVTKILSGTENLTIETLSRIHRVLDVDFDLVSRPIHKRRARQIWEQTLLNVLPGDFGGIPRRRATGGEWQMERTFRAANDSEGVEDEQVTRQLA